MIERIGVLGIGKSGMEVAKWVVGHGLKCVLSDQKPIGDWPTDLLEWCEEHGVEVDAGGHGKGAILSCHMVVPSPGVPLDIPVLRQARAQRIPIVGELALALSLWDGPKIGITGTNGKTTCTTLVAQMLHASQISALVGGNIGTPLLCNPQVTRGAKGILLVEVSSFQLDLFPTKEAWRKIRPFLQEVSGKSPTYPCFDVAILLNITEDHLERYGDFERYVESKARVFSGQPYNGWAIVEETALRLIEGRGLGPRARRIIIRPRVREGRLVIPWPEGGYETYDLTGFRLIGGHNLKNLMAAIYAARISGARESKIQDVIGDFRPLSHRLEFVAKKGQVLFVDDSKATNLDATLTAIEAVGAPVVLICGGLSKGQSFTGLKSPHVRRFLRGAVLLGESVRGLEEALAGVPKVHANGDGNGWEKMRQAVNAAYSMAREGDVVLLSPACASFDLFSGYSERGEAFKAAVRDLSSVDTGS